MLFRRVQVDVLLARRPDFAEPLAGKHEQADGGRDRRRLWAFGLDLGQHPAEPGKLLFGQRRVLDLPDQRRQASAVKLPPSPADRTKTAAKKSGRQAATVVAWGGGLADELLPNSFPALLLANDQDCWISHKAM